MHERQMHVADLPAWNDDGDLVGLDPAWLVTVEMMNVPSYQHGSIASRDKVREYAHVYRAHGAWGLPPVIVIRDKRCAVGDVLVTGNHRLAAAALANLAVVPKLVVHVKIENG